MNRLVAKGHVEKVAAGAYAVVRDLPETPEGEAAWPRYTPLIIRERGGVAGLPSGDTDTCP
ncbi:hypothetical protein ACFU99_02635 [Streptomyces sp. NPDC057654]|uniref:hypothetical protein n=1 Tax=Streptomyces sp. NPDC057654 TaxID=3346196 RepID=UPI00367AED72